MIELYGKISVKRLVGYVNTVPGKSAGELQEKTVIPTGEKQTITPDGGYAGMSRVYIEAMDFQAKTVAPGASAQVVTPDEGYSGLKSVTVEAAPLQQKTVELGNNAQTITPDDGFYGLDSVNVPGAPLQEKTVTPTGDEQDIEPDEGMYGLSAVHVGAAALEEVYISATSEEQTITPSEGYYGFSKIVVEAVDEDDGSGGTGGGSSGESYPDAESTTFGYEYSEQPIPTGYYYYGTCETPLLEFPEGPGNTPYCTLMTSSSGGFALYYTSTPFVSSSSTFWAKEVEGVKRYGVRYECSEANKTWELVKEYTNGSVGPINGAPRNWFYNNYAVYKYASTEIVKEICAGKVPETVNGVVATPVPREETYSISGDTLNDLIGKVQQITGGDLRTPSEAASALSQYIDGTVLPDTTG